MDPVRSKTSASMKSFVVAVVASIVAGSSSLAMAQSSSTLTMNDYNASYQMILRLRPIGDELANFIVHPSGNGVAERVQTQECMIRLLGTFQDFQDNFTEISNLVGLSVRMKDIEDKDLVVTVLGAKLVGFLKNVPSVIAMIDSTAQNSKCAQNGAALAKVSEIKRSFADVERLAQSFADHTKLDGGSKSR